MYLYWVTLYWVTLYLYWVTLYWVTLYMYWVTLYHLCFVDKDSSILPAILGSDDSTGFYWKIIQAMVITVVLT